MKLARYWIPLILGFTVGSLLSIKMSGTPMRDLLTSAKAEASDSSSIVTDSISVGANAPLAESERFIRFFSAVQEFRALKRRSDLHSAIGDLGSQDMEPLLSRIESLRWKVNTNELNEAILQHWLEIDRSAAASWIRKHPQMGSYQVLWAKSDPEAALRELRQNPQTPWQEEIMRAAVDTLASDPDQKARLILQLPDSTARNQVLLKITNELAAREPSEALKFAQNIPEAALRSSTIANLLTGWARGDAEGAAEKISARFSEIENTRQFGDLLMTTILGLAKKDVNRAFEWIGTLPEHQRSAGLYSSAACIWAASQPVEALQWCADNGIDASFAFLQPGSGSVVTAAAHSRQMETLQWIQSQPAGAMRDALMEQALVCRLPYRGAPAKAQTEITLQGLYSLPEESQIRVATGIGRLIAGGAQSAEDVSGWLKNFQDPALRAATIAGAAESKAFHNWKDPSDDFSSQFEEGPDRDAALRGMTNAYRNSDERIAADTALKISDQTLQLNTLDTFMVDWLRKDSKAATLWLKNATSIPSAQSAAWQREANSTY